jgi:phage baseplate assembly protein W
MKTRTFVDFDASFLSNPTTRDLTVKTNDRAIKAAVRSLVLTSFYEKPFHPEIGSQVNRLLFENFGDMFVILMKESVTDVITNYEPRVTVTDVDVIPNEIKHSVVINIKFTIKNTTQPLNVSIVLDRTR